MPEWTLLNDEQVMDFIIRGYHVVATSLPAEFHNAIDAKLTAMNENPGNEILDVLPELHQVYADPNVRGALVSLLGPDVQMHEHRHWHMIPAGRSSQGWHQDGLNERHHHVRVVLAMYYPQDVTAEMGPTVIVPGTHFRNCPTERMATYANIRGQVALTVKAGTVAITHYDLWHAGTRNRSTRPRHMLKFLFSRGADPEAPSWNHDPGAAFELAARKLTFERSVSNGQSDYYKEQELRREMWEHMLGKAPRRRLTPSHSTKNIASAKRTAPQAS
ncbi:MAG: phytanoyl-CoA dioxygenase family protein [Planctomycetes bacterium]|nr:phytanoyl-CoA dioxygenase family protein [Planctomycetota bacterium]